MSRTHTESTIVDSPAAALAAAEQALRDLQASERALPARYTEAVRNGDATQMAAVRAEQSTLADRLAVARIAVARAKLALSKRCRCRMKAAILRPSGRPPPRNANGSGSCTSTPKRR